MKEGEEEPGKKGELQAGDTVRVLPSIRNDPGYTNGTSRERKRIDRMVGQVGKIIQIIPNSFGKHDDCTVKLPKRVEVFSVRDLEVVKRETP
jgi:hypothetical protein